jgi:hypothetical protein
MSLTPLALPGRDAAAYLKRFSVAALYVLAPTDGLPSQPGATTDLGDALARTRKIWPRELVPQLLAAWWVSGIHAGQSVLNLALACDLGDAKLERGCLPLPAPVVAAALAAAAQRLEVPLTNYQTGLARVKAARATLGGQLDKAQASGDMREFNVRYRSARLLAGKANRGFPSYPIARARLEAELAACAASGAPVDFAKIFEEVT